VGSAAGVLLDLGFDLSPARAAMDALKSVLGERGDSRLWQNKRTAKRSRNLKVSRRGPRG
jgi:hypothetical protein